MKVSVIIPIYNCEDYLAECLDSVLGQTYQDWECICVDDGSTDSSGQIIENYAKSDLRFKAIHKINGGEGSARNAGLDTFQGDLVYFLDSDDVLNSHTLEYCVKGIQNNPNVCISNIRIKQFPDGTLPFTESENSEHVTYFYQNISKNINSEVYGLPVWSAVYRAELVRYRRFTDLKVGADRVFVLDVISEANEIVSCSYIGYGYRTRNGSIVNTPMTAIKFLSDIRHRMFCLNVLVSSDKEFDQCIIDCFVKYLCEYMGYCFFRMTVKEQKQCLNEWCDALVYSSLKLNTNIFRRLLMKILGKNRLRSALWLAFCLPYWLKKNGVNRQFAIQT